MNGFADLMVAVLGPKAGVGARSAVGQGSLPRNISVEVRHTNKRAAVCFSGVIDCQSHRFITDITISNRLCTAGLSRCGIMTIGPLGEGSVSKVYSLLPLHRWRPSSRWPTARRASPRGSDRRRALQHPRCEPGCVASCIRRPCACTVAARYEFARSGRCACAVVGHFGSSQNFP